MDIKNYIEGYKKHILPDLHDIKSYFEEIHEQDLIKYASVAVDPNGKMNSHQRRVGKLNCEKGTIELLKQEAAIFSCKNFEQIFAITESVRTRTPNLGDLWSYDTALRIGFKLRIYPEKVYVQAGVIKGINKIFGNRRIGRAISKAELPEDLQGLEPYEIENFLCVWGKF